MKQTTHSIIHILCMTLAAALVEVFLILCLAFFKSKWEEWLYLLTLIGGTLLNIGILTADIVSYFLKKEVIYKTCITLYVMLAFFSIGFYILLKTGFLEILQDEGSFESYLEKSGSFMTVLFILLQFLQVVILPIPSTVTVVAGSALFGPLMGSIYSLTGIIIGSLVAFLIGRYAGYRVVAWMIGKETLDKWLKKIKGKDKLFLSAMFLLPVFPDDVLCFIAGISSMSVWYFFAIILISRVLAIFTTSYSITLIPVNTWWGLLIWGILIALVIVLFIFLYKKSDKILAWFEKKIHRETRVEEKLQKDEFELEVVNPDGALVKKGVKKNEETQRRNAHNKNSN